MDFFGWFGGGFFWFLFLFLLFRISLNMIEYFSIVCLNVLTVL